VYTDNYAEYATAGAAAALGQYFDGSFFSGEVLPIEILVHPFSAVIDMEDGTLLVSDIGGELEGWQIIDAVEQANSD
jgi:hypothetical protein